MNGIEKLTQQINADAQAEIDEILAAAKAEADAVAADYAQRAEKAAADVIAKGTAAAQQREERLISIDELVEAAENGKSIFKHDRRCKVAEAYTALSKEVNGVGREAYRSRSDGAR